MSYTLNRSTAPLCRSQDRLGGVAVAVFDHSASSANEDAVSQQHAFLGSRSACVARHRRVGGLHQHHLPASPLGIFDQGSFDGPDRRVGGLAGHRRLGEKLGMEVLDGDGLVIRHDLLGPDAARVGVPALRGLGGLGRLALGALVALGLGVPPGSGATGHLPLRLGQLGRRALPVPDVRQVVGGVGRGRRGGHAPVDADSAVRWLRWLDFAAHDEAGVPVSERVLIDAGAGWVGRKLSGPDDRDAHTLRQAQPSVLDREAVAAVRQRRQALFALLDPWASAAFHLERMVQRLGVRAQRLLLGVLGALAQPCGALPCFGQQLRELAERRPVPGPELVDGFVPQEAAAVPFLQQCALSRCAGAQAVRVAHCLFHNQHYTAPRYIVPTWSQSDPTTTSSTGAPTTSSGAPSTAAPSSKEMSTLGSSRSSARSAQSASATSSSSKPCRTTFTYSSSATRNTASTASSSRSRAARPGCCATSSPTSSPGCRRFGRTPISSPQSAARHWRPSRSTWPTNATSDRPYLPTAKAGGFSGGLR